MIGAIAEMFSYAFMARALAAGALVALCASLLGAGLVLKHRSMIGDGLSHVGFGALAISAALNAAPLAVCAPVVVAASFLLLRLGEKSRIKGDAAIAMISAASLAVGVMTMSLSGGMNADLNSYLFGSILAMSASDAAFAAALACAALALFTLFYNKIFAVVFDEDFARAAGVRAGRFNTLNAILTAATIVIGMRMMGALLISSLLVFPPLTAMRLCKNFRAVTLCSALVSLASFFAGMAFSYVKSTPAGASIVLANAAFFLIFSAVAFLRARIRAASARRQTRD
jgi:ABC-type Mn2+/Zn2+ transport systems, permease components